jgi:phosphatidylcholine synthase
VEEIKSEAVEGVAQGKASGFVWQVAEERAWLYLGMAWGVHLLTAFGAVAGLMTLFAIVQQNWIVAFVWMAVSLIIDSIDGSLARLLLVKERVPEVDGALLDNVVDYFTYVIVPGFFLVQAGLLPAGPVAMGAVSLMVLASGYQFSQTNAKTGDHFFTGFPSYWNIVVFYLFFLELSPWVNLLIVLALVGLVFVPIKYIYPSRSPRFQYLTLSLSSFWAALCAVVLTQYPNQKAWPIWTSLLFVVYYVGVSLLLMRKNMVRGA